jgi:hypothetical protein
MEETMFKFEQLSFEGSQTPTVIQTYLYPTIKVPPS